MKLWLCGLGIELCFTPKAKPQKQGCVERSHQTMYRQVIAGQVFKDFGQLFERCQKRRNRLNKDIPCSTIGEMPPFAAFPNAIKSNRPYNIQKEEELFDDKLVDQFLKKGKWYRKISCSKTIEIGGMKYYLSKGTAKQEVLVTYNPYTRSFIFKDSNNKLVNTRPVKGISYKELAGDIEEARDIIDKHTTLY
jgi:transposase InsO family protein